MYTDLQGGTWVCGHDDMLVIRGVGPGSRTAISLHPHCSISTLLVCMMVKVSCKSRLHACTHRLDPVSTQGLCGPGQTSKQPEGTMVWCGRFQLHHTPTSSAHHWHIIPRRWCASMGDSPVGLSLCNSPWNPLPRAGASSLVGNPCLDPNSANILSLRGRAPGRGHADKTHG